MKHPHHGHAPLTDQCGRPSSLRRPRFSTLHARFAAFPRQPGSSLEQTTCGAKWQQPYTGTASLQHTTFWAFNPAEGSSARVHCLEPEENQAYRYQMILHITCASDGPRKRLFHEIVIWRRFSNLDILSVITYRLVHELRPRVPELARLKLVGTWL